MQSDGGNSDRRRCAPNMIEVTEEAYELVEERKITEEDFREFVFVNPTKHWTDMNPKVR